MTIYRMVGKRLLDILLAVAALVVLLPLILLVAMAVRVRMGRPVLFKQQRVGMHGRLFTLIKFRTMVLNSNELGTVTVKSDPRITPLGQFLRCLKVDELPQLLNVLVGDMSIVGPRPDVPELVDSLVGGDRIVLSVRPGLTGPASVIFAHEEDLLAQQPDPVWYNRQVIFKQKTKINKSYIEHISVSTDLYWICRTVGCLWTGSVKEQIIDADMPYL